MPIRKYHFLIWMGVGILVLAGLLFLQPATKASAQCGSQASSCKNCHEVQGQDPVNNDGKSWHTAHAFGDFCYACHGGNNTSLDKATAHAGMVSPLSDVKAACQQCHPNDLQARAQVYADELGVQIGTGATPAAGGNNTVSATPVATQAPLAAPASSTLVTTDLVVDDPNLVNYTARYDEIVLGKKPTNWGNIILMGLIGLVAVGGGGFVINNEKLIKVSFGDTQKPDGEFPTEVLDMLPAIARLQSTSRKSLRRFLENPKKAEKVLSLMDAVVSEEKDKEERL